MNQREWKNSGKFGIKLDYTYYNKSHRLMKQFNEFNKLTNEDIKTEVHHLRDTEEQRKYNDEHYELWGHNLDGTFEYGKYVIFVTKEEHTSIHSASEETRKKISESNKISHNTPEYIEKARLASIQLWQNDEYRSKTSASIKASRTDEFLSTIGEKIKAGYTEESHYKMSIAKRGKPLSDEHRNNLSKNNAKYNLGKHLSDSTREKLRLANLGKHHSEETKKNISENHARHNLDTHLSDEAKEKLRAINLGKHHSEETKKKISDGNKGKLISEETRKKIGDANKGHIVSDETKEKISESLKEKSKSGWNPNKGRKHSDETKEKFRLAKLGKHQSESSKEARRKTMIDLSNKYKVYKENGGILSWNEFQKAYKLNLINESELNNG